LAQVWLAKSGKAKDQRERANVFASRKKNRKRACKSSPKSRINTTPAKVQISRAEKDPI